MGREWGRIWVHHARGGAHGAHVSACMGCESVSKGGNGARVGTRATSMSILCVVPALLHDNVCRYSRSRHCNRCYRATASGSAWSMCECVNTASEVVHVVRELVPSTSMLVLCRRCVTMCVGIRVPGVVTVVVVQRHPDRRGRRASA